MTMINLYEAKTKLSALVEQAAAGEDIIIAKNGVPRARLVAIPVTRAPRVPNNSLGVTYMADDFDAPDEELIAMFEGKYSNDDWLEPLQNVTRPSDPALGHQCLHLVDKRGPPPQGWRFELAFKPGKPSFGQRGIRLGNRQHASRRQAYL